jgi:cysteine synthase A
MQPLYAALSACAPALARSTAAGVRSRPLALIGRAMASTAGNGAGQVRVFERDVKAGVPGAIGNTPLMRLKALSEETGCEVLGKCEWMNPGGSVKDRAALALVSAAEASGALRPGGTVVEGTAGNTGVGICHVANARGYRVIIYMPNTQSQEKIDLLRQLGADVRPVPAVPITDPAHYTFQARDAAAALPNAVWTNQFDNTANRDGHFATTGPEIWAQTGGRVDAFICATGTGGTLAGVGRFLKQASGGATQVWLADPPGSVLYSWVTSGGRKMERAGGSITEGIGQGRVTDNLAGTQLDGALFVEDARTVAAVFRLLKDEGLYIGASSALNVVAAGDLARRLGKGKTVVTVICDSAARYQSRLFSKTWLRSKGLYDAVPEDCRHLVSLP